MNITRWTVITGGTQDARRRWPTRTYRLRSSARRRARYIHGMRDIGVAAVWILPVFTA